MRTAELEAVNSTYILGWLFCFDFTAPDAVGVVIK